MHKRCQTGDVLADLVEAKGKRTTTGATPGNYAAAGKSDSAFQPDFGDVPLAALGTHTAFKLATEDSFQGTELLPAALKGLTVAILYTLYCVEQEKPRVLAVILVM